MKILYITLLEITHFYYRNMQSLADWFYSLYGNDEPANKFQTWLQRKIK